MLDLAGIMFSTIMMIIAVSNAVRLDRTRPWFERTVPKPDNPNSQSTTRRPWQRDRR